MTGPKAFQLVRRPLWVTSTIPLARARLLTTRFTGALYSRPDRNRVRDSATIHTAHLRAQLAEYERSPPWFMHRLHRQPENGRADDRTREGPLAHPATRGSIRRALPAAPSRRQPSPGRAGEPNQRGQRPCSPGTTLRHLLAFGGWPTQLPRCLGRPDGGGGGGGRS